VPFVSNYSATKAYILTLGEALNVELKPFGIDVTVLSPGLINKFYVWENRLILRSWPVKLFGLLIKRAMTVKGHNTKVQAKA
jgi:short-subunit dehydrogenase